MKKIYLITAQFNITTMKTLNNFRLCLCMICIAMLSFSCQKEITEVLSTPITVVNPGFEDGLTGWTIQTDYTGVYGFSSNKDAAITGSFGLNFYASQLEHWQGAPQETPWNGKIYQTITGLKDGTYSYMVNADAVGKGMYLWANGGEQDAIVKIKSPVNELHVLDFVVVGGIAKIGFTCIDADGDEVFAPYFHADNVQLWIK